MHYYPADILLLIQFSSLSLYVSVWVWLDVKVWWLGNGVLKLVEELKNCENEESGYCVFCGRDYR